MSTFAIIPWSDSFAQDRMFDVDSEVNRDYLIEPYLEMKLEFERLGHEIHTIDYYVNYDYVDYFLFFTLDWDIYKKLVSLKRDDSLVYCTAEPPSVYRYNSPAGYRILKHIFPYILTWNDDWVDNKSIFKRNLPYYFIDQTDGNLPFEEKKLITFISGDKCSGYPGELYSERRKAINYFETNHPDQFDFFGAGWDENVHKCYKGKCESKAEVFHKYRFAICFENIEGLNGYITEKILDCLESGIVPIYAGAPNIEEIIPKECFINYRRFDSFSELYEYISSIDKATFDSYLHEAKSFISTAADCFSGSCYAHFIIDSIRQKKVFKSSFWAYKYFQWRYIQSFTNKLFR